MVLLYFNETNSAISLQYGSLETKYHNYNLHKIRKKHEFALQNFLAEKLKHLYLILKKLLNLI